VWVRLKDRRERVHLSGYRVIPYAPFREVSLQEQPEYRLQGTCTGYYITLDEGGKDEMNARFDDMAAYQDKAAYYKSGVMWCYDMNVAVGESQGKVSKDGVSQG
jgi:hypothetical protein